LVIVISLFSMPDGSCLSVKCGRYIALPLHMSTPGVFSIYWFPFKLDLLIGQASYLNLVDPTSRSVVKVKCTFNNSRWGLCWSRSVMSRNYFPWTVNVLFKSRVK
jgi:hypothetical protein